jgi:hypothetical protein
LRSRSGNGRSVVYRSLKQWYIGIQVYVSYARKTGDEVIQLQQGRALDGHAAPPDEDARQMTLWQQPSSFDPLDLRLGPPLRWRINSTVSDT